MQATKNIRNSFIIDQGITIPQHQKVLKTQVLQDATYTNGPPEAETIEEYGTRTNTKSFRHNAIDSKARQVREELRKEVMNLGPLEQDLPLKRKRNEVNYNEEAHDPFDSVNEVSTLEAERPLPSGRKRKDLSRYQNESSLWNGAINRLEDPRKKAQVQKRPEFEIG